MKKKKVFLTSIIVIGLVSLAVLFIVIFIKGGDVYLQQQQSNSIPNIQEEEEVAMSPLVSHRRQQQQPPPSPQTNRPSRQPRQRREAKIRERQDRLVARSVQQRRTRKQELLNQPFEDDMARYEASTQQRPCLREQETKQQRFEQVATFPKDMVMYRK